MKYFQVIYKSYGEVVATTLHGESLDEINQYCAECINGDVISVSELDLNSFVTLVARKNGILLDNTEICIKNLNKKYIEFNHLGRVYRATINGILVDVTRYKKGGLSFIL